MMKKLNNKANNDHNHDTFYYAKGVFNNTLILVMM